MAISEKKISTDIKEIYICFFARNKINLRQYIEIDVSTVYCNSYKTYDINNGKIKYFGITYR